MFYSKTTGGFYDAAIHGDNIPADAVEITAEEHAALLAGQSAGKIISADADGRHVLIDPPAPSCEQQLASARAQRRAAYVAESDPLKTEAEYDALLAGTEPDYTAWMAAVEAIKARYPLPEPGPEAA